ncbi:hypothetical protein J7I80_06795 [Bacillus sp. ISL-41]|uniref:hypothetical protein n=1 Tax=Bacillus sp. ISL-41 TaxID=2819127 RepID=UPI001BE69563|nr:hypothetical protein [Bacillus sp. ISL-41]MBT2641925.1 hypothetical protein [Bacillus sp. ISL-41]
MRQLIGAIYLSFGFLFYLLKGFDNYYTNDLYGLVVFGFIFTGIAYLFKGLVDYDSKKNND